VIGKVCRRGISVPPAAGLPVHRRPRREHGLESKHRDAHIIAGYDRAELLEPPRDGQGRPQVSRLAALLDAGQGRRRRAGYHWRSAPRPAPGCAAIWSGRTAPGSTCKHLGLAPEGDPDGVRWVAVRHADNHVHAVATLVRQDDRTRARAAVGLPPPAAAPDRYVLRTRVRAALADSQDWSDFAQRLRSSGALVREG
jgi:hypothetical protein